MLTCAPRTHPVAIAPGTDLIAPQADPDSNESFVVFDSILLQELNELVAKGNLPVVNTATRFFNVK